LDKSFKNQINEQAKILSTDKSDLESKELINSQISKRQDQNTLNNDSLISKNTQTKNITIALAHNSLDRKDEISNLQNNNHPYLFNEASNFAPFCGNLTNLFYDNENSMRMFQNNNYNSNIFNNDNLFHSNNNSFFIKNNNNEDSLMVNKKNFFITNDKNKSNNFPYSFNNNNFNHLTEKEKTSQKFSIPEIINNANFNKNKNNSNNNSLIEINNSNKNTEDNRNFQNGIKIKNKESNQEIQLTKKKTKRSKMPYADSVNNVNPNFNNESFNNVNIINESISFNNSDKKVNKDLELSQNKMNSNSKTNKKCSNGKNNKSYDKTQSKSIRRSDPIKLDELLNETEKNISYSNSKNLNKTGNSINLLFRDLESFNNNNTINNKNNNNVSNNYLNLSINNNNNSSINSNNYNNDRKTKSIKNSTTNANCNNTSSMNNNTNKKPYIINQNNYFNNYNSTAANSRFVNAFANIDIPDPSGFIGKGAKGAFAANAAGFVNPQYWQMNQLGTAPFINPAYIQMQKTPMMYVPANYVFGDYDFNSKCDFPPNVGIFPANPLISGTVMMSNNTNAFINAENAFINKNNSMNNNTSAGDNNLQQVQQTLQDNLRLNNKNQLENKDIAYANVDQKGREKNKNDKNSDSL